MCGSVCGDEVPTDIIFLTRRSCRFAEVRICMCGGYFHRTRRNASAGVSLFGEIIAYSPVIIMNAVLIMILIFN